MVIVEQRRGLLRRRHRLAFWAGGNADEAAQLEATLSERVRAGDEPAAQTSAPA